jgi:hypothetical protein
MATTPNYNFYLPEVGDGSVNSRPWGLQVNANFTNIDATLKSLADANQQESVLNFPGCDPTGVTDSSAAFNAAIRASKRVYVPSGIYILDNVDLANGTELYGDGPTSILRQPSTGNGRMINANRNSGGSSDPSTNLKGIHIHDLRMEGRVATLGFFEQSSLVYVSAVSSLMIERCTFYAWQGDAVTIASGDIDGLERHNEHVTVRDCFFDGYNKDNRQGISILDCNGLLIENCSFVNCTRSNMPGAIDFEPNASQLAYGVAKNVTIRKCRFKNIGGNVGTIGFMLSGDRGTKCQNFLIEDCQMDTIVYGIAFLAPTYTGLNKYNHNVVVRDVTIVNASGGFSTNFDSVNKGLFENFSVTDSSVTAGRFNACSNFVFNSCSWTRDVIDGNGSVQLADLNYNFRFNDCRWEDCGAAGGGFGVFCVNNLTTETSVAISFVNCRFTSPLGKMLYAIYGPGHRFVAATNKFIGCTVDPVLGNSFVAEETDTLSNLYTPVATGVTTAGTPTYTTQYGEYRRVGKTVFFRSQIETSNSTGMAGNLQISLPTDADQIAGQPVASLYPVSTVVDGVASTGGQFGAINPLAVSGGHTGSIRMFMTGTGVASQITTPAGAFKVYSTGVYTGRLQTTAFRGSISGTTLTLSSDAYGGLFALNQTLGGFTGCIVPTTITTKLSGTLGKAGSTYTVSQTYGTIANTQILSF